ncbi:ribosome biogenesis protein tsr1 [Mycoemilia scoparia]|uniref:Ribosome biogenesis protein tsr1 n=1 Tax=Mycoemilia scoparia TaxID=417184 RepID=A0A9W8A5C2_9FUNG|nr:ribosome biogenesis protein tsr1 [Mycoemilia scoparia]
MVNEKPFHHRSTLKQTNKPFKRKHATKNVLRDKAKGKVQRVAIKGKVQRKHTKADRRNQAKLEQKKKREQLAMTTRLFTGRYRAPKIVAVIPLCSDVSTADISRNMFESVEQPFEYGKKIQTLDVSRFNQTLRVMEVERNLIDILDAAKVADYIVFGISANTEVDSFGELCLTSIQNQGLPSILTVIQHLEAIPPKKQSATRKSLQSFIQYFFPDQDKLLVADTPQEALNIIRIVTSQIPKSIAWRDQRPYLVADELEFTPGADNPDIGQLALTGYLRGMPLSANRLIHIPNYGDFQIDRIESVPMASDIAKGDEMDTEDSVQVLDTPDPDLQDSLVAFKEPDVMANEQTWPEEHEMAEWESKLKEHEAREAAERRKNLKQVPKGTSAYQANWIIDSGSENGSDYESDDMDEDNYEDVSGEEYEEIELDGNGNPIEKGSDAGPDQHEISKNEDDLEAYDLPSAKEDQTNLDDYLQKQKDTKNDMEFPDEVDTPLDQPARVRFARYRGLQSFRTSPWDPYENLPLDYARIFQFENFKKSQSKALQLARNATVKPGARIRIILKDVTSAVAKEHRPERLITAFGLLQYEHQMSVLNFTVQRNSEYTAPVKSKEPLIMQYGFRRYLVHPLYSQNTRGGPGTNNVHKFERFLQPGRISVGTVYAPIQFGRTPVTLFLPNVEPGKNPVLVGTGSTLDINPLRILAKRIILTGIPYKINKKSAVIRYMFFNPEDIAWFKPVQISTKCGRIGHISESLGTHGYMKCIFDGQLKQMDTVCMNLYKRVFPKWNTELWKSTPAWVAHSGEVGADVHDSDAMEI